MVVRQDVECGTSKDYRHAIALGVIKTKGENSWKKKFLQNRHTLKNIKKESDVYNTSEG